MTRKEGNNMRHFDEFNIKYHVLRLEKLEDELMQLRRKLTDVGLSSDIKFTIDERAQFVGILAELQMHILLMKREVYVPTGPLKNN